MKLTTKKIIYCSLFLFFSNCGFTQSVNFTDLKSLLEKNISDVQDFLIKKKFTFYNQDKNFECENYHFSKERYGEEKLSSSFVVYQICPKGNVILFKTNSEKEVLEIKQQAQAAGMKFDRTENAEGKLVTVFLGKTYEMWILSRNTADNFTVYEISLEKRSN